MGIPRQSEPHSWTLLLGEMFGTSLYRRLADSHHSCGDTRNRSQVKTRPPLPVRTACHDGKARGSLPNYLFLVFLRRLPLLLDYLHLYLWHEYRNWFAFLRPLLRFLWLSPSIVSFAHGYTSIFPKLLLLLGSQQLFCSLPFLYPTPPRRPRSRR